MEFTNWTKWLFKFPEDTTKTEDSGVYFLKKLQLKGQELQFSGRRHSPTPTMGSHKGSRKLQAY